MDTRVFELRTYYPAPGRMAALHARFRDHTCALLEKHGMKLVGFWVPLGADEADSKLVYLVAHPSKDMAEKNWQAFRDDPDWKKAREESEKDGKLLAEPPVVEWLRPTDYSALE